MELLNPFFARMIWQEMLEAVDHIHHHRIVHGDLKPANFVFVKGHLKLIDFGIAKAFSNDTTNIYRESQIGTVNYMAPEAIAPYAQESPEGDNITGTGGGGHSGMSMRLGRASDVWSLGCILYQMVYGRPPFAALTTIQKLHAIPNPKVDINYPDQGNGHAVDGDAVGSMKVGGVMSDGW
jgi:serine/threonine-protein kinase TTK/MPS1